MAISGKYFIKKWIPDPTLVPVVPVVPVAPAARLAVLPLQWKSLR